MDSQNSTPQDASSVLRTATFTHAPDTSSPETSVTASDFLLGAYDPAKLHPMAGLEDKLDYLLLEDDKTSDLPGSGTAMPSRGWSDDLCYGTGTMYLSGTYLKFLAFHLPLFPGSLLLFLPCSFVFLDASALTPYRTWFLLLFPPITC